MSLAMLPTVLPTVLPMITRPCRPDHTAHAPARSSGWPRRLAVLAVTTAMAWIGAAAVAQTAAPAGASVPSTSSPSTAAVPDPARASTGVGSGAGYHDPRSPFKPLQEIDGVLSWKLLSSVTTKADKQRVIPTFPGAVLALDKRTVKVQGFMLPLEPGDRQSHFLLSAVPTSCSFCVPAGPEGLVEVRSKTPVRYTLEPVTVEGQLAVLNDDPYGMFYRVTQAVPATIPQAR